MRTIKVNARRSHRWLVAPILLCTVGCGMISPPGVDRSADPPKDSFSIAIIPDTQKEVSGPTDSRYANRTQWLADRKDDLGLVYVIHTGDNVNYGWLEPAQYEIATHAIGVLAAADIPYALAVGNHDTRAVGWDGVPDSRGYGGWDYASNPECPDRLGADNCKSWLLIRQTEEFNTAFPLAKLQQVGGAFEPGKADNVWSTFSAAGTDWLVLTIELWPRLEVLEWAESVVASNPHRNVIIATHHYLDADATISESRGGYGKTSPKQLYDSVVSRHANVKIVVSGHNGTFAKRTDANRGNTAISYLGNDLGSELSRQTNPVRVLTIDTNSGTITGSLHNPVDDTVIDGHNTTDTITLVR